jgi:hypothetical protein
MRMTALLPVATAMSVLETHAIIAFGVVSSDRAFARKHLTIKVEVRVEANPRPLKMISNQSSKSDVVFRFQRDMRPVPKRDSPVLARVKTQYFPVRRMILCCGLALYRI